MKHIASEKNPAKLTYFEKDDIQPNATDLTIDKIFEIKNDVFLIGPNVGKLHRGCEEIPILKYGAQPWWGWDLKKGVYQIIFKGKIDIPEGYAGWIITRSTLNRNGVHITTGLYDSGYSGLMVATLHINCGNAFIEQDTRLGQFLLFDSETLNLYNGDYGKNSKHDKVYV